ncbi:hypothetical protein [Priestia megaterium]
MKLLNTNTPNREISIFILDGHEGELITLVILKEAMTHGNHDR